MTAEGLVGKNFQQVSSCRRILILWLSGITVKTWIPLDERKCAATVGSGFSSGISLDEAGVWSGFSLA